MHTVSDFIALHTTELIELMCEDALPDERTNLRQFAELLQQVMHLAYHPRLVALKNDYAPFDPDSDASSLGSILAAERQHRLNEVLGTFTWLLNRANFRHFDCRELTQTLRTSSDFGIHMDVDFSAFEHVAMFVRGETHQSRTLCNWRTWFQPVEVDVPIFRRLVLIMKLRPNPRLGPTVDTEHVFLKIFKDIPRADADMLLPGARVKLKLLDRGKLGAGIVSGIGTICYRMSEDLGQLLSRGVIREAALWGLLAGLAGYGYKSYYDYQQTRQAYHLNLTQSLYFQNLDSNTGVLTRLFDEAEEQEVRTALLAYYSLWRFGNETGLSEEELELVMELYLDRHAGLALLCESGEPLRRLTRLGLVEVVEGRFYALPLADGIEQLRTLRDRPTPLPV